MSLKFSNVHHKAGISGNCLPIFFFFVFTYSLINQLKPGIIKRVNRLSTPIAGLVSVNIFTDLTVWVFLKGSLAVWCISNNAEDLCEYLTYVDNCNG